MIEQNNRVPDGVRARLVALPGVRDVDFARYPDLVFLRCDVDATRALVAEAVGAILRLEAGVTTKVEVDLDAPQAKRARFETLQVDNPEPGRVAARVTLEWNGERHEGQGEGEASSAGELRASATATMRAIEKVMGGGIPFNLIGVKDLRVFDHDLVAVLLHSPQLPDRRLLGTSIITDDRGRAAAFAVLNATNRVVGNLT